jgi:sodium transport system permease protein
MKLATVMIIARKEFRDVTRDRRTLMFMMLLPIVVMPLLVTGVSRFAIHQMKAKGARELTIAANPLAHNQMTVLATGWVGTPFNIATYLTLSAKLGVKASATLEGLGELSERVEKLKAEPKGKPDEDAEMLAQMKAMDDLTPDQKQFLADASAVTRLLTLTKWTTLDDLQASTDGKLAQGVTIPDDLPPTLSDPRVAFAITNKDKAVHAALDVPVDALDRVVEGDDASASVKLTVLYDSSQSLSKEAYERLSAFIDAISRSETRVRLAKRTLSPGFIKPYELAEANVASDSRQSQAFLGGLLPYLAILFSFFGAFYPSLDLTAGEKERFTLETLLLAPVTRLEIAAGKFVVVFAAAITAAVLTITSMALTFTYGVLPEGAASVFHLEFQPLALVLTASLLVPVAALFASLLLGVALCARSFKEAQSYAAPIQFLIIMPAVAAMMPDLETELKWAWVPLMNVSLLMKELLKGNYLWDFYFITLGSMLALAAIVLFAASRLFQRESVLLRT